VFQEWVAVKRKSDTVLISFPPLLIKFLKKEEVIMLDIEKLDKLVKKLGTSAVPVKIINTVDISIKLDKPNFLREEYLRLRIEIAEVPGKRYIASLVPQPFTCLTELSTDHALFSWAKEDFTVAWLTKLHISETCSRPCTRYRN
jgi:hypothetical protein